MLFALLLISLLFFLDVSGFLLEFVGILVNVVCIFGFVFVGLFNVAGALTDAADLGAFLLMLLAYL